MALSTEQVLNYQKVLRIPRLHMIKIKRMETWNTRSLFAVGKLDNVVQEIIRMNIDILNIAETKWSGTGVCKKHGATI